ERTFVAGSTRPGGMSATSVWSSRIEVAIWSAATHGEVAVMTGWVIVMPQGTTSCPPPARVPSSSTVIVGLRLVIPVTTASGKLTGGIAVAVGVGPGLGVGLGDGRGVGLGLAHPTMSVTTARAVTPRSSAGGFTALW